MYKYINKRGPGCKKKKKSAKFLPPPYNFDPKCFVMLYINLSTRPITGYLLLPMYIFLIWKSVGLTSIRDTAKFPPPLTNSTLNSAPPYTYLPIRPWRAGCLLKFR